MIVAYRRQTVTTAGLVPSPPRPTPSAASTARRRLGPISGCDDSTLSSPPPHHSPFVRPFLLSQGTARRTRDAQPSRRSPAPTQSHTRCCAVGFPSFAYREVFSVTSQFRARLTAPRDRGARCRGRGGAAAYPPPELELRLTYRRPGVSSAPVKAGLKAPSQDNHL